MKSFKDYITANENRSSMLDKSTWAKMTELVNYKKLEQYFKLAKELKAELEEEGFDRSEASQFLSQLISRTKIEW